jgi:hypothetical protein
MTYNTTFTDTSNNIVDILAGLNNINGGYVAGLSLFILFLILMISLRGEPKHNFITASAVLIILTGIYWKIGLVNFEIIFVPITMLFIGLVTIGLSDR